MGFGVLVHPQTHFSIPQVSLVGVHHICGGLTAKLQSFLACLRRLGQSFFGSLTTNLLNARDDLLNRAQWLGGVKMGTAW